MPVRTAAHRLGLAAVVGVMVVGLTGCGPVPLTVATTVTYDCQINTNNILIGTFSDTLDGSYEATAPQAVAPGAEFDLKVVAKPFTLSASSSGGSVSQLTNVVWRVAIPANTTLVSQAIAGWANVGAGVPTSAVSGGAVVITVPGPIAANVVATFPVLTMKLKATGALGTRIQPTIAGTSYAAPGLSLNARVTGTILGTLNPTLKCFPSPNKALHNILISNDTAPPVIAITAPAAGQTVVQGSVLKAAFSCNDGTGVGVATCVGTVANGATISTATLGAKSFTVTSTDNEGKSATATVSYTVVAA